jgi:hypothetical protein
MSIISSNLVTILTGLEQNLSGVKSKNNFTI